MVAVILCIVSIVLIDSFCLYLSEGFFFFCINMSINILNHAYCLLIIEIIVYH